MALVSRLVLMRSLNKYDCCYPSPQALGYENDCQCLRQELDSPQVNTATETLHTQNLAVTSTQTKQQQRQQLLQEDPT